MKTFVATLAALAVAWLVRESRNVLDRDRALRMNGAWFAFEVGTTVDADRLIRGELTLEDWTERQARRERELRESR